MVAPSGANWIGVYNERLDEQDPAMMADVAESLTRSCETTALAVTVHDSDQLCLWCFERGIFVAGYERMSALPFAATQTQGDFLTVLARLSNPPASKLRLQIALWASLLGFVFADARLERVAAVLGIIRERVVLSYGYIEEHLEGVEDAEDDFIRVK